MKKLLLTLTMVVPILGFSQWSKTNVGTSQVKEGKSNIEAAGFYSLNEQQLKQSLRNAPQRFSNAPGAVVNMPTAEGKIEQFEVWEASNFAPTLQEKFPEIRSYIGIGIDSPTSYLRFSVSPDGVSTMILKAGKSEFIEPYTEDGKYIVFDSKSHRNNGEIPFECSTPETSELVNESQNLVNTQKSSAGVFKTYRLAMSCTGEYAQRFGSTVAGALAAINATMTRVNGVYEKDFAVNFTIVDNTDIIYLNPSTDPYTSQNSYNTQLHQTLKTVVGFENYDIGHLVGGSGGGGNAGCIGCICQDEFYSAQYGGYVGKGAGYTSLSNPQGDTFDIDFVAHEIGHQVGANHTFSHGVEGTGVNVEPGSGSTIMGYAGITSYNVQMNSDDYFTFRSVQQVQNNLQNKPCGINTTLTNQTPIVNAGDDYNIPKGTAFVLRGTGSDPNGDPLVYTWEQNDSGNGSTTNANSRVSFTKTIGPNFRSVYPSSEPVRYMPQFDYVLERDVATTEAYWRSKWEAVTTVTRTFNFTLTARDNNSEGGQTHTDAMRVLVRDAGPFKVTSPADDQNVELGTNSMLVEWDVAGTNAEPINTANVKISLSTDNGETFTVVAASTPNDGSQTITIPTGTTATDEARILIEAVDNIYYAVSRPFNLTGVMGVEDLNNIAISIYPNPNNGQFFIKAGNIIKGEIKTSIFDTTGKMVYNKVNNHAGGNVDQSISVSLPTGVYIVVFETENGKNTQKLIIK